MIDLPRAVAAELREREAPKPPAVLVSAGPPHVYRRRRSMKIEGPGSKFHGAEISRSA